MLEDSCVDFGLRGVVARMGCSAASIAGGSFVDVVWTYDVIAALSGLLGHTRLVGELPAAAVDNLAETAGCGAGPPCQLTATTPGPRVS